MNTDEMKKEMLKALALTSVMNTVVGAVSTTIGVVAALAIMGGDVVDAADATTAAAEAPM